LITGGAGFSQNNLVEYLVKYKARKVRVLDNLSTGHMQHPIVFNPVLNLSMGISKP
jgi:UDP-N-acetylglucosamine 4-epimerase